MEFAWIVTLRLHTSARSRNFQVVVWGAEPGWKIETAPSEEQVGLEEMIIVAAVGFRPRPGQRVDVTRSF